MTLEDKAFKLASAGHSNAEIFGALELTSGALQKLLQTKPQLLFRIIQGRTQYIQEFVDVLANVAMGGDGFSKGQLASIQILMQRAEDNNKSLCVAHEMILLAGTSAPSTEVPRDAGTVTQLLRAQR